MSPAGGIRHATCRQALLDGDLRPEVAAHLDDCERCRRFATDLGQVGEYAAAMDPGPAPDGMADRVIAAVLAAPQTTASEPGGNGAVVDLDRARSARGRGPLVASLAVAALVALVVGSLALVPRGGDSPQVATPGESTADALLISAERALEAGTARVRLRGTTTATITPPALPALPEVQFNATPPPPPEMPPFQPPPPPDYSQMPDDQREQAQREYEQFVAEARARHEQFAAESRRQYEEQFERMQSAAGSVLDAIQVPDEFSFTAEIAGDGAVEFPDRMRIDGEMTVDAKPAPPGANRTTPFGFAVDGSRSLVRSPDGTWVEVPSTGGPLMPFLGAGDGIATILRGSAGKIDDLGVEKIAGVSVRHLRFRLESSVLTTGAPPGADVSASGSAEVWIGVDDDVVYRMSSRSTSSFRDATGFSSSVESTMLLELYDFGAEVSVEIPEAGGSVSSPLGPSAVLTPFNPDMAAGFFYAPPVSASVSTTPPTFVFDPR